MLQQRRRHEEYRDADRKDGERSPSHDEGRHEHEMDAMRPKRDDAVRQRKSPVAFQRPP